VSAVLGTARRGRWRQPVLWVSLAANLFFVALLGTHSLMRPAQMPPGLDGMVQRLASALPADDAARFRAVMERERPSFAQSHRDMEAARAQLAAAIAAQPFDEPAVGAGLQAFRASWMLGSDRFSTSLLAAVRSLSPDGRARLGAAMLRPRHP